MSDPALQSNGGAISNAVPFDPVMPSASVQSSHAAGANPGSSVASLWIQVTQEDKPPASIPSTLASVEPYPGIM